jgi:hypothetical protein
MSIVELFFHHVSFGSSEVRAPTEATMVATINDFFFVLFYPSNPVTFFPEWLVLGF